MQITVGRTLAVNGIISANGKPGTASGSGGGAGGSLWLTAGTLSGSGKISADGGDGEPTGHGGGGGGGRIAVYFNTNQFAGIYSARGGAGPTLAGGAGTIYIKTNSSSVANLLLNNGGAAGTNTPISTLNPPFSALVTGGAALVNSTGPLTFQNLSIGSGGLLRPAFGNVDITVIADALVTSGALISADAHGNGQSGGTGHGHITFLGDGSGAGYGGAGGASINGAVGGITYGSSNQPTDLGSCGGISPISLSGFSQGGGAIRLKVNGTLTMNGLVSANGADAATDGAGGGSGGSIWITAKALSGNGFFTANGGIGELSEGGGGGGGRIAINADTNAFSGNIFVVGGDGAFPGQDGTIFVSTNFVISGSVSNTSGLALEGITLQPSGLDPVSTDSNGFYSVTVPLIWNGSITPTSDAIFIPASRTYASLYSDTPNQDFIAASASDFDFSNAVQFDGTNAIFNWYGINGVSYQPLYSTNLVDWLPYGSPIAGTNGPIQLPVPAADPPQMFFRLNATY
jgi:hypothetical protein